MRKLILLFTFFLMPFTIFSMTVYDPTNWQVAYDQYVRMKEQLDAMKDTSKALTEIKNFEDAFDFARSTRNDLENFWDWTPSIEDLENMAAGNQQTGSLGDRIAYYNAHYGNAKDHQYFSDNPSISTQLKVDVAHSSRYGMVILKW